MIALVLDISTSTGWAIFSGDKGAKPVLIDYGTVANAKKIKEYGQYPWSYILAARDMVAEFHSLIKLYSPDCLIIEETNKARSRYTQKILEFMHALFLDDLQPTAFKEVFYINTSDWRRNQNCNLSPEDKKQNARLSRAKKSGKSKKDVGIRGKITPKHVAIRRANEEFPQLNLIVKDDDIADAIMMGLAFFNNVELADGE